MASRKIPGLRRARRGAFRKEEGARPAPPVTCPGSPVQRGVGPESEDVMPDTKIRSSKATSILREDHRSVKKLFAEFDKLEESDLDERTVLFRKLKQELTVHSQIEEEIFYPAVQEVRVDDADELVREAQEEHRIVETLIEELSLMRADDPQFCAKLKVLKDNVLHHIQEEEHELFPIFEGMDKESRARISEQLAARKLTLSVEEDE